MPIAKLTFTHTDCLDVYGIYASQMERYFPEGISDKTFVLSNAKCDEYVGETLIYNSDDPYPRRLRSGLIQLKQKGFEYLFFDHEDMFLYDHPDVSELMKYRDLLLQDRYAHIRLIKGGKCFSRRDPSVSSLYRFIKFSSWIFSIQPSYWKINTLIEILDANLNCNIWELEERSQKVVKNIKADFAFSHRNGIRRGKYHFDNDVYPYVATAVGKGKWNFVEYRNELEPLLTRHNIDKSVRGIF